MQLNIGSTIFNLPNKKPPFETPQLQNNYSETTTTISLHARLSVLSGKLMSHFLLDIYTKGLHLRLLYSEQGHRFSSGCSLTGQIKIYFSSFVGTTQYFQILPTSV